MTEHIQVVPDKCRACRRCEVACIAAHHGMSFKEAMKHRDELVSRVQVVKTDGFKTTVRCHQCDHAPCANVCPTGALQQDPDGRIIMRVQYCVACKMCIAACPYGTITLDTIGMPTVDGEEGETLAQRARREVAVRCDMCRAWRMQNGKRITACMEACPAHALSLVLADGSVVEAPAPEKKPAAVEGATEKPAAPVAEPGPRASVTAAGRAPEEAKPEEAKAEAPAAPAVAPAAPAAPAAEAVAAPVVETPAAEGPAAPKAEEPKAEAPVEAKAEAPAEKPAESPKAEPVAEAPAAPVVEETPAPKATEAAAAPVEAAPVEAPVESKPAPAPAAPKAAASKAAAPKASKSSKKTTKKGGKK